MAVDGLQCMLCTGSKGAAPIHVNEFTQMEGTDGSKADCFPQGVTSLRVTYLQEQAGEGPALRGTVAVYPDTEAQEDTDDERVSTSAIQLSAAFYSVQRNTTVKENVACNC